MALDAFALVLIMLALGKLGARLRLFPRAAAEALNAFVLYLCLPAAILRYAPKLEFSLQLIGIVLVPWLILGISIAAVTWLARLLRLGEAQRAVLLLCVPLGNTSFLGYPLTLALLGEAALPHAVIYDQFGSFVILSTWGLWVLARYGGDATPTARHIAGRLLRFPPFLALLFALLLMPAEPPELVGQLLIRISDALLPVVAFAVGLSLRFRLLRADRAPLLAGLGMKLMVLPLLAVGLSAGLGLSGVVADVAVLETAMPPMITAAALAISHRLAPDLAAALVGYGTLLALLTLPMWAAMLTSLG